MALRNCGIFFVATQLFILTWNSSAAGESTVSTTGHSPTSASFQQTSPVHDAHHLQRSRVRRDPPWARDGDWVPPGHRGKGPGRGNGHRKKKGGHGRGHGQDDSYEEWEDDRPHRPPPGPPRHEDRPYDSAGPERPHRPPPRPAHPEEDPYGSPGSERPHRPPPRPSRPEEGPHGRPEPEQPHRDPSYDPRPSDPPPQQRPRPQRPNTSLVYPDTPPHQPQGSPSTRRPETRPPQREDERPTWTIGTDLRNLQPLCGVRSLTSADPGPASGYQTVPFIVGGNVTEHSSWPWMAKLEVITDDEVTYQFICGGSLISGRYIVTAAHCFGSVPKRPEDYKIVFFSPRPGRTLERDVEKILIHERYNSYSHYYDIAVLRFDRDLLKPFMPICLPSLSFRARPLTDETAHVIGWGTTKFGGPSSKELREVTVPIWSNEDCKKVFGVLNSQHIDKGIEESQLCAGRREGGADACQGDSGGPLMFLDETKKWTLVGVVSFGHSCASPDYPGVYTRISSYMDWLGRHVNFTA